MNKEDRADEEERLGKYQEFNTIEELIADLHSYACRWVSILCCPLCGIVFYPQSATDTHCI